MTGWRPVPRSQQTRVSLIRAASVSERSVSRCASERSLTVAARIFFLFILVLKIETPQTQDPEIKKYWDRRPRLSMMHEHFFARGSTTGMDARPTDSAHRPPVMRAVGR